MTNAVKRKAISAEMKLAVLKRDHAWVMCSSCQLLFFITAIHYDHHLALVDGGEHTVENLRALCITCHREKSSREHIANCKAKRLANPKPSKTPMRKASEEIKAANRERRKQFRQQLKSEGRI